MKRSTIWLTVSAVLLSLVISLAGPLAVDAANTPAGGNGLRVSPVRTDVTINPGQTKTVSVNVTNVTTAPASLQGIVNDFTASNDESGDPAILLNANDYAPSHSLKRFAAPINNFTLQPGEEKAIPVTITVPKNAAGGGYFGAIRFAPTSSPTGANVNVSLAGSVGSLILLKVPGNITEKLSIASFDTRLKDSPSDIFTKSKNIDAVIRLQNEGNIQEAPYGKILLKNHSGKVLATYELNAVDPPGNVLPDSIRKFSIPLKKVGSFGQFKIEGNFGYGSGGQLLTASTTFYVIPVWMIALFIAVVGLIVFLIFGLPRLVRAYNRRVLRKAGRRY